MTVLKPQPYADEGPQPLVREIPRGAEYPVHALGLLRPLVEAVQSKTQAPYAIAAQSSASVASRRISSSAYTSRPKPAGVGWGQAVICSSAMQFRFRTIDCNSKTLGASAKDKRQSSSYIFLNRTGDPT